MKRNVAATPLRAAIAGCLIVASATIGAAQTAPTFAPLAPASIGAAGPQDAVVADLDGDEDLDLVVTTGQLQNPGASRVNFLLNDGAGLLTAQLNSLAIPSAGRVAVADFNGDGASDFAITVPGGGFVPCGFPPVPTVAIFLGNTFARCLPAVSPLAIQAGDFNEDGFVDLAVASGASVPGAAVRIHLGNGNGTFGPGQALPDSGIAVRDMAAPIDLNGDNNLDLVVAYNAGFKAWLGNGLGLFQPGGNTTPGGNSLAVAAGDVTGDGIPDLVEVSPASYRIDRGVGNGSFTIGTDIGVGPGLQDLALADMNGDGHLDIVIAGGAAGVRTALLLNNGSGSFTTVANSILAPNPVRAVPADWNGDGAIDLGVLDGTTSQVFIALQQDGIRPTVDITTPADGSALFTGMIPVSALATDNSGVARVEFFANEAPIGSSNGPDFSINWNASSMIGSVTIRARAFDAAGNFADDSVSVSIADDDAPNAPANVAGTSLRNFHEVRLEWAAALDNIAVAHYRVYELVRGSSNTTSWQLVTDNVMGTSQIVEIQRRRGEAHIFAVSAVDAAGNESARSAPVSVSRSDTEVGEDQ
jgi:hypothetical protein